MSQEASIKGITGNHAVSTGLKGLAVSCLLGLLWIGQVQAQEVIVTSAGTERVDDVYRLDADIEYHLPKAVLDALESGVVLTLVLDIEVYRERAYLWDDVVAELEQRYQLQYHALTEQYLLRNLNSGSQASYPTLDIALFFLGRVRELPVIDANLLEAGESYRVRMRSRLDLGSLPVPLQLRAYLSSDWSVSSDWYAWPL